LASKTVTVSCTGTKKIFSGGGEISATNNNLSIQDSYPASDTEWSVTATETDSYSGNWHVTAWAICAEIIE